MKKAQKKWSIIRDGSRFYTHYYIPPAKIIQNSVECSNGYKT